MDLAIIVATLEGCPASTLNDPNHIRRILREAVVAGDLTLIHESVHHFDPHGVTGTAVLAESHIAIHTWPEDGVLFVDIATCAGRAATEAAFARICEMTPHEHTVRKDLQYASKSLAVAS